VVRILPFRDSHYDASTTSKNHLRSGESRRFRLAGHRAGVYGFQLYSLGAALVFHEIFFPEQSAAMALILAMGTYGAGYIARIVGAFIFGRMGDSIGRKKVLFITITMMGICTTLIGVLPTYAQIGILPRSAGDAAYYSGLGPGQRSPGPGPCWRSTRRKVNAASSPRWWRWGLTAGR
jgi:MFS family permease